MFQTLKKAFSQFASSILPSELDALDPEQLRDLARDVGVSVDDLYRLEVQAPGSAELLSVRLAREGIEPAVLQARWPSVWKDLQRVCALCNHKEVCRHELAEQTAGTGWQQYCPNADTIEFAHTSVAARQADYALSE